MKTDKIPALTELTIWGEHRNKAHQFMQGREMWERTGLERLEEAIPQVSGRLISKDT